MKAPLLEDDTIKRQQTQQGRKRFFKNIATGFGLAAAILVVVGVISYRSMTRLVETSNQAAQTQKVIGKLDEVVSQITDAETGQRGYVITGEETYLEPYHAVIGIVNQEVKVLRRLTAANPNQQRRLDTLEQLVAQRLAVIEQIIDLRKNKGFEAAQQAVLTGKGKNLMDDIRACIREMENEENVLLTRASQRAEASARNTIVTFSSGIFLNFFILAGVYYSIAREIAQRKLTEKSLRQSEERFQVFMNNSPAVAFMKDEEGRFVYVNEPWERSFNIKVTDWLGKTDFDLWPAEIALQFRENDTAVLAAKKTVEILETFPTPDGCVRHWLSFKFPCLDSGRRLLGGVAIDITDRKQAEEELQRAHDELEFRVGERTQELTTALRTLQAEIAQRQQVQEEQTRLLEQLETERGQLEAILSSMTDGLIVGDLAGNFMTMNPAALHLYEYQSVDEARRYLEDPDTFELYYLDGRLMPVEEWPFARALQGEVFSNFELHVRRIDTGKSWFGSYTGAFVRNKAGEIVLAIVTIRDITERMQAEKTLHESFQRYRFLADTMPQIVWTAQPDGTLDYYNQPWYNYTGMTFEQTKHWDWGFMPVLHPDDLQRCVERWTKAIQMGESYEIEYRFKRASDGTYRWHLGRALPMRNQKGEIVQWVGTCTDIDDQKQAESALRQAYDDLEIRVQERTTELATANQALQAEITERSSAESALQQANEKLNDWVSELEQRNREVALLRKISDILQACLTVEEAYTAIAKLVQPLFPQISGGIFLINASKNLVEAFATWGAQPLPSQELFTPDECWALRRGRVHRVEHAHGGLVCKHVHHDEFLTAESLCVPMMAQGEALGVLYLSSLDLGRLTQNKQQLAVMVAEHIALALANLKLRETLQNQSIRDPLTGLFNRRYLEESLEREVNRAQRKQQSLGIIMLDVDHFKRFNDTFGHEAGDTVLRELGQFLQKHIRGSDIACRYGGEELTLILPEASLDVTHKRAEQIREGAKQLQVQHHHQQPLGTITLSLGVACFPEHGLTGEAVIQAADAALYRAKKEGRDAVRLAS